MQDIRNGKTDLNKVISEIREKRTRILEALRKRYHCSLEIQTILTDHLFVRSISYVEWSFVPN